MTSYFGMGGYAVYVWSAYALAALVLIGMVVVSWRSLAARQKELALLQQARDAAKARRRGTAA